jgi:hypothetical protein
MCLRDTTLLAKQVEKEFCCQNPNGLSQHLARTPSFAEAEGGIGLIIQGASVREEKLKNSRP